MALTVFLLWCFCHGPLHAGVSVCAVHLSWALFVWCTTAIATAITPGLRDSVPETTGLNVLRLISMHISCTLYICLHYYGDFHHIHVITTVLHQWPPCWVFDVGVCRAIPAEETSAVGALPASISLRSRRVLLTCPLWQKMWENSLPLMFCKSKAPRQLHEYQSGLSAFSVGCFCRCLNVTGFQKEHQQVVLYLSETYKVKVDWITENVNK